MYMCVSVSVCICIIANGFTACKEHWIRDGIVEVGPQQIRLQTLGRFVGHLHSVLQDRNREIFARITGQP